jgi:hypothetical protein
MNMFESCARFQTQTPEALADVLTGLVTGIRKILVHPDMRGDQKIIALFELVDDVAPPPSGRTAGREENRAAGEAEAQPPGAGTDVTHSAAALFTHRAAQEAGEPLRAVVGARTVAVAADYPELQAGDATALRRDGHLVTASGRRVAAVSSVYLPGRIPPEAAWLLAHTSTPLGLVLEPYGVWREPLEADGERTRGLLKLPGAGGDVPVAVAWELAL